MNGLCDWCEEPATMKRGIDDEICDACDERLLAKEAAEWERDMGPVERMGWMRAREEGVD